MSQRVTRGMVEAAVKRLAALCGKVYMDQPWVNHKAVIGAWTLDHNSVYGGYRVEEICNEGGAIREPLLRQRLSGSEMLSAVNMAADAVALAAKNHFMEAR